MKKVSEYFSKKFFELINSSKTIFITGHSKPDGDTIGSSLALKCVLNKLGKKNIDIVMNDKVKDCYDFLPNIKSIKFGNHISKKYDLGIILECSDIARVGFKLDFSSFKNIINIDHHQNSNKTSNENSWLNIIYPRYASCAEIIFDILENNNFAIDKKIALCLYVGIVTDTGKFQWANTDAHVFETSAKLLRYGVDTFYVYKNIYGNKSIASTILLGKVLQSIKLKKVGRYVVSYIEADLKMFEDTNTNATDTEEFINFAISIKDVDIAIFFREDKDGYIKVSFRSDKINVRNFAEQFSGGGHPNASGATVFGNMEEVKRKVLGRIKHLD